jgi:type IV secretion system protein VirB6
MPAIAHAILDGIVTRLATEAGQLATTMMDVIKPISVAALTIYILLWGLAVATGRTQEPFSDGAKRILRIIFIVLLAFTSADYQSNVIDFFMNVPAQIAGQLVDRGSADGLATVIDDTFNKGMDIATSWFTDFSIWHIGQGFRNVAIGALIALLTVILCGIALATVFLAYLSLTILLAVGPLFIMLLILDQTKRFFDGWLSQVMTFAVVFVLVSVACLTCMDMLNDQLNNDRNVTTALTQLGFFMCMIVVMVQIRPIAAAIGGGVSMQSLSIVKQITGNATGAIGRVTGTAAGGARFTAGVARGVAGAGRTGNASGRARLTQSAK